MEDFVTWVDSSKLKRTVMKYNDEVRHSNSKPCSMLVCLTIFTVGRLRSVIRDSLLQPPSTSASSSLTRDHSFIPAIPYQIWQSHRTPAGIFTSHIVIICTSPILFLLDPRVHSEIRIKKPERWNGKRTGISTEGDYALESSTSNCSVASCEI